MARRRAGLWVLLAAVGGTRQTRAAHGKVSRLKMVNGCNSEAIWIAHMAIWPENGGVGPDPQNIKLQPGESYDFRTPPGLSGTRYWPKMGCDDSGNDCKFGDSGGPDEICNEGGCGPPVDTKFEASFGKDKGDQDWVDISLVDGYTLPFRFELDGKCGAGFDGSDDDEQGVETNSYYSIDADWTEHCEAGTGRRYYRSSDGTTTFNPPRIIDCSRLDFEHCPEGEDVSAGGAKERKNVSLKVIHPSRGGTVGCYSPCSQLSLSHWSKDGAKFYGPPDDEAAPYCCPTPPESPESCRQGPVGSTKFVKAVHEMCPGVYGYSYDDGMGLLQCPPDTKYKVTFYCPAEVAPAAPQSDPLLPPLKQLVSSPCTTTTTTALTTATTRGFGFVPEYVPPASAEEQPLQPAPTLEPWTGPEPANQPEYVPPPTQAPTTQAPRKPSKSMPSTPAMAEDVLFDSMTSTTTVYTTSPPLPDVVTNDLNDLPVFPPLPAGITVQPTAAPMEASSGAGGALAPTTPAPNLIPQHLLSTAPSTASTTLQLGIPALAPPPVPPPVPAHEPVWMTGIRNILQTIGLASKPRGLGSSSSTSGPGLLHVLGFLALLATFVALSGSLIWRCCNPRQLPVYNDSEYGQLQPMQGMPAPSGLGGPAGVSSAAGGMRGGYYSYR